MEKKWSNIVNSLAEFFYGERGIETTAYADRNLNTYNWDFDEIIRILKLIKEIELTDKQIQKLERYKENFLEMANDENEISQIHNKIMEIYENIDEY